MSTNIRSSIPPAFAEFRIFISTISLKMRAVRDTLQNDVLPELRERCRERQIRLVDLDVRWGISEGQARQQNITAVCLNEINGKLPIVIGIIGGYSDRNSGSGMRTLPRYPWQQVTDVERLGRAELEVMECILDNPFIEDRAIFYVGSVPGFPENSVSADVGARVERLCNRLFSGGFRVREFSSPAELRASILRDLLNELERYCPVDSAAGTVELDRRAHEAFAAERRNVYVPVGRYADLLDAYVDEDLPGRVPLAIVGQSGVGKSALLAFWSAQYRLRNVTAIVIEHYVGASDRARDRRALSLRTLSELKRRCDIREPLPTDDEQIAHALQTWPVYAQPRKVVVILDALDQLEETGQSLAWLPSHGFPANLRLIVSTTDSGTVYAEVFGRGWRSIRMEGLTQAERWQIVNEYLARYGKRFTKSELQTVSATSAAETPLFLRMIVEELRIIGSFEDKEGRIKGYLSSTSLDALFGKILEELEQDAAYGAKLVMMVTTCLWASRNGLSEEELVGVTKARAPAVRDLLQRLAPYLTARDGVLAFFHDRLRLVVQTRYLSSRSVQMKRRSRLAEYFLRSGGAPRAIEEGAWQLEQMKRWDQLRDLITGIEAFEVLDAGEHRVDLLRYWRETDVGDEAADLYLASLLAASRTAHYSVERIVQVLQHLGAAFNEGGLYRASARVLERAAGESEARPATIKTYLLLSATYRELGRFERAGQLLEEVIGLPGIDSESLFHGLESLGNLYYALGDYARAQRTLSPALRLCAGLFGIDHPKSVSVLSLIGAVAYANGNYVAAEHIFRSIIRTCRQVESLRPEISSALSNLAVTLQKQNKTREAMTLFEEAIEADEAVFGPDHPQTALKLINLGQALRVEGEFGRAEDRYSRALRILLGVYGENHLEVANCRNNLGTLYSLDDERFEDSRREFETALGIRRAILGEDSPMTINTELNLAGMMARFKQFGDALRIYEAAIPRKERVSGSDHPETLRAKRNYQDLLVTTSGTR